MRTVPWTASKFARDNLGIKLERQHMGGLLDAVEAQAYYNYVDHVMDTYSTAYQRYAPK